MSILFRPARAFRREQTGKACPVCETRMHWSDIVAIRGESDLIWLHESCALAIAEQADAEARETEES